MSTLIEACKQNRLPSFSIMCDYGLDGRDGVNPVILFEAYRKLVIDNKISAEELENAMKSNNLKNITGINVKSGYQCIQ
jgi:hypothetical protein